MGAKKRYRGRTFIPIASTCKWRPAMTWSLTDSKQYLKAPLQQYNSQQAWWRNKTQVVGQRAQAIKVTHKKIVARSVSCHQGGTLHNMSLNENTVVMSVVERWACIIISIAERRTLDIEHFWDPPWMYMETRNSKSRNSILLGTVSYLQWIIRNVIWGVTYLGWFPVRYARF